MSRRSVITSLARTCRPLRSGTRALLAVLGVALTGLASGQLAPELDALFERHQDAAAERLIAERLARNPDDHVALRYAAMIPIERGDVAGYDEAIVRLERCVALQPQVSDYHLWLGRAYGVKAQNAGVFNALGLVRDVRAEFLRALELDPLNHDARHDLLRFYLEAPRIVGGGVARARALADDCEPHSPDMARVLRATIAMGDDDLPGAWREAGAVGTPADARVNDYTRTLLLDLGEKALAAGQAELSRQVFARAVQRYPGVARAHYGLGRSYAALKRPGESIVPLAEAVRLDPSLGAQYELALALHETGDRAQARQRLEEFRRGPGAAQADVARRADALLAEWARE